MNAPRNYTLYNPKTDTVLGSVKAMNATSALDWLAQQYGYPSVDEMQEERALANVEAHLLN
jgi:hypothetical protein